MPTPYDRIIASEKVTDQIVKDRLLSVYTKLFEELKTDLRGRMGRWGYGKPWGGSDAPEVPARLLLRALKNIRRQMLEQYGPWVVEALGGELDRRFLKDAEAWVDILPSVRGAVPAWFAASDPFWSERWKTYLREGSLVEKKLLEGAYARGGLMSQHARLYERTQFYLQSNLNSGKNFTQIMTEIERKVWGIDYTQVGPQKKPLAWIRRLIRSEYQYAHNTARHDLYQREERIIGYEIALDPDHCPVCSSLYGQRFFYYKEDGRLEPPSESHPNCHCSVVRPIWQQEWQTREQVVEIYRPYQELARFGVAIGQAARAAQKAA